jgi:hypothetical protein
MNNSSVCEDIQISYAKVFDSIFNKWVHDDDGANNHFQCQVKQTKKMNSVYIIYQPIGNDDTWFDDACVLIIPTKESGIKLTEEIFKELNPYLEQVENKLIDSINSFITKYGIWMEPLKSEGLKSFKDIVGILEPLHLEKGKLKMKYKIKNFFSSPTMHWRPVELVKWMYNLPAYKKYRAPKLEKNISLFEEYIEKVKDILKDLEENVDTNSYQISQRKQQIEEYRDIINKYQRELNFDCDISILRKVKYHYDEPSIYENSSKGEICQLISYKEAFPERSPIVLKLKIPLAGMKRKLEE